MSPLTLQAGESSLDGSRDARTGLVSLRLRCHAPDLLSAMYGPLPGAVSGLAEAQARIFSRDEAGDDAGYHVEVTLEGFALEGDPPEEDVEYTLDGGTSEDPIESHPNLEVLLANFRGEVNEDSGRAQWPLMLADGTTGERRKNPMHGVVGYLYPELFWTRRMLRRTFPASLVATLGTIDTPPGRPPELSGNRNWIKIRARATWRGNIWQIEESWRLSAPGGWLPEMYPAS